MNAATTGLRAVAVCGLVAAAVLRTISAVGQTPQSQIPPPSAALEFVHAGIENGSPLQWEWASDGSLHVRLLYDYERNSPNRAAGHGDPASTVNVCTRLEPTEPATAIEPATRREIGFHALLRSFGATPCGASRQQRAAGRRRRRRRYARADSNGQPAD